MGKPELSSVLATGSWLGALIGTRCLGPKEIGWDAGCGLLSGAQLWCTSRTELSLALRGLSFHPTPSSRPPLWVNLSKAWHPAELSCPIHLACRTLPWGLIHRE